MRKMGRTTGNIEWNNENKDQNKGKWVEQWKTMRTKGTKGRSMENITWNNENKGRNKENNGWNNEWNNGNNVWNNRTIGGTMENNEIEG